MSSMGGVKRLCSGISAPAHESGIRAAAAKRQCTAGTPVAYEQRQVEHRESGD